MLTADVFALCRRSHADALSGPAPTSRLHRRSLPSPEIVLTEPQPTRSHLLRRTAPCPGAPAHGCSERSSTRTARARQRRPVDGRPIRRGTATRIQATRAARRGPVRERSTTAQSHPTRPLTFDVPIAAPGVDASLLDPRSTWSDPEAQPRAREGARAGTRLQARVPAGAADGGCSRRGGGPSRATAAGALLMRSRRVSVAMDVFLTTSLSLRRAGCAGRAAIEAHDVARRVAVISSKLHHAEPFRRLPRGRRTRRSARTAEADPREARAFGSTGPRVRPTSANQAVIEIFTREGPCDMVTSSEHGRASSCNARPAPFGAAGSPRTVYAADTSRATS